MSDEQVFARVQEAIISAKAEVVTLTEGQVSMTSILSEPPLCLDSLESIAMVSHLEDAFGLVAEDEHFFSGTVRNVADVVDAVKIWIAESETPTR